MFDPMDKDDLPVFHGGKDRSQARAMIDRLGGQNGIKTARQTNADGSVTTVQLKGTMPPQVSRTSPEVPTRQVWVDILSGATKNDMSPALFCPTQNAYQYALHGKGELTPDSFNPADVLRTPQVNLEKATSYTGLMAKLVQILLGYQTLAPYPPQVTVSYSSSWKKTHGISKDDEGKLWLVAIGDDVGVIAMPLPVIPGSGAALKGSPLDAVREAVNLFGGLPSGENFPSGAKLLTAIEAGTVKRLATVAQMQPYFSTYDPVEWLGWSFNKAGTEAHNTSCWMKAGTLYGGHFRVDIDISAGSALLTLVEEGPLYRGFNVSRCRFNGVIFTPRSGRFTDANTSDLRMTNVQSSGPVFVCHIDDKLEIVRDVHELFKSSGIDNHVAHPVSTTYPYISYGRSLTTTCTLAGVISTGFWLGYNGNVWTHTRQNYFCVESSTFTTPEIATFIPEVRDGYVLTRFGEHSQTHSFWGGEFVSEPVDLGKMDRAPEDIILYNEGISDWVYADGDTTIIHVGAPEIMRFVSEPYFGGNSALWREEDVGTYADYVFGFSAFGGNNGFHTHKYTMLEGDRYKRTYGKVLAIEGPVAGVPDYTLNYNFIGYV